MEWSKLFASLPDNPRVQAAEDDGGAGWLLIQSFCYCTSAESGGFIPKTQVPRFGGPRLRQRVAVLVREGLWITASGDYLLDPEIWNEDRNLSDSAEKKRQADRERIAAKRAAAKASSNGHLSRDSRATGGATSSRDSRTVDKKRVDLSVVYVGDQSPERNAQSDTEIDEILKTIIQAIYERTSRCIDADWAAKIRAHILGGHKAGNPAAYVKTVIENEPDPHTRFLPQYGGTA